MGFFFFVAFLPTSVSDREVVVVKSNSPEAVLDLSSQLRRSSLFLEGPVRELETNDEPALGERGVLIALLPATSCTILEADGGPVTLTGFLPSVVGLTTMLPASFCVELAIWTWERMTFTEHSDPESTAVLTAMTLLAATFRRFGGARGPDLDEFCELDRSVVELITLLPATCCVEDGIWTDRLSKLGVVIVVLIKGCGSSI